MSKTSKALHKALQETLSTLTPRERQVLSLRGGRVLTLKEVGHGYSVQAERIRQIEAKALRKCRHPSRAETLHPFIAIEKGRVMFVPEANTIISLSRLCGDLTLVHRIFGEGPLPDELRAELKAHVLSLIGVWEIEA